MGTSFRPFKPPYMSFQTFRNFMLRLNPEILPPRLDRTLMVGMAGGTQTLLLQTMRGFGLVTHSNEVTPRLLEMLGSDEAFERGLLRLLDDHYPEQLALARKRGSTEQLYESFAFSGYTGSTLRKAVTFYLHASRAANAAYSPYFRAPSASDASRIHDRLVVAGDGAGALALQQRSVVLRSGGELALTCDADFLSMSKQDRLFVNGLLDLLAEYEAGGTSPSKGDAGGDRDGLERLGYA